MLYTSRDNMAIAQDLCIALCTMDTVALPPLHQHSLHFQTQIIFFNPISIVSLNSLSLIYFRLGELCPSTHTILTPSSTRHRTKPYSKLSEKNGFHLSSFVVFRGVKKFLLSVVQIFIVECSNTTHMSFGDFMFAVSFPLSLQLLFTTHSMQQNVFCNSTTGLYGLYRCCRRRCFACGNFSCNVIYLFILSMPNIRFFITTLLASS